MEGIILLFAITTSLASMYELIIPVMNRLEITEPHNMVVESKYITYITFFLLGIITSPFLLPITVVPSYGERFRNTLTKALHQD